MARRSRRVRWAIATAALIVAQPAAAMAGDPPTSMAAMTSPSSYRSSVMGVSLAIPDGWTRQPIVTCASGRIGKTEDELERMDTELVRLHNDHLNVDAYLSAWRIWEDDAAERVRWLTGSGVHELLPFTFGDVQGQQILVPAGADRVDGVTFVVEQAPRRVELTFVARSCNLATARPQVEALAASLRLFEPVQDEPAPGTTKVIRGDGFVLRYPGDWTWRRPLEDDPAGRPRAASVRGPKCGTGVYPAYVEVEVGRHAQFVRVEDSAARLRDPALEGIVRDQTRFVAADGRPGLRFELNAGPMAEIWYLRTGRDDSGGMMGLRCVCPTAELVRYREVFERIARELEVD